jgi:hypothetical protein
MTQMTQIAQIAQMGAGPTCMGPPKATSGSAGGLWGRRYRASKKRDPGALTDAHAAEAPLPEQASRSAMNLCESVESVDPRPFLRHL